MKRAGLVLEGGANRGIFTAGVLDYLMEQDYYIPYVVGTSAGACNATGYVAKQPGRMKKCTIITEKENRYVKEYSENSYAVGYGYDISKVSGGNFSI